MSKLLQVSSDRLYVVDALRGVALFAIVILHNYEHYNFYCFPDNLPNWMLTFDPMLCDATSFSLAGKAFTTFSLLFGLGLPVHRRDLLFAYCNRNIYRATYS